MDFDELTTAFEPALKKFCFKLTHNREIAEDLVQDTFVKALSNLQLLTLLQSHQRKSWLLSVAKNLFLDHCRKQRHEELGNESIQSIDHDVAYIDVERLLGSLPPSYQEVLILKYQLGMSSQEIAISLKISDVTVRRKIQIGMDKIKQRLKGEKNAKTTV